jgi:hypothetical protein
MKLTGLILFVGSLTVFVIWLYKVWEVIRSIDTRAKMYLGAKLTINILPGIILFIVMAISAGMAWG